MSAPVYEPVTTGPALADGVRLQGALQGSGHREAPGLVVRPDGQTLSLTPVLYALAETIQDHPGAPGDVLRQDLSDRLGRDVSSPVLDGLLAKLEPLGVLAGGPEVPTVSANPLLALRHKVVVSDPKRTARLAGAFTFLFHPVTVVVGVVGFLAAVWVALVVEGLAGASRETLRTPGIVLAMLAVTVLSAGLHELGHAAACRARGGQPGAMGAGLYLVWPAFYTDVNDSYRLDRRSRLLVDLGGLWVNAVLAATFVGVFAFTGWRPLLLGVVVQLILMLRQLAPIVRADGYHILADLTGVPDLFAHIKPTVTGLLPWNWRRPSPLRGRARAVVSAWVLVVVPLLLFGMLAAVLTLPRVVASTAAAVTAQAGRVGDAGGQGHWLEAAARAAGILALCLPVGALVLFFGQTVKRTALGLVRSGRQSPRRGVANGALAAVLVGALAWAWWPAGQWAPIRPDERGTLAAAVQTLPDSLLHPGAAVARRQLLTRSYQPALALVPRGGGPALLLTRNGAGRSVATLVGGPAGQRSAARTFPFDVPPLITPDGQRTLAVGLGDGGTVYDVAYAVVRVDDGSPVTPSNEAWALASCVRCTTVAVSFQVVLVVGQSNTVAPINAAVAANRNCVACATAALALQLVASLPAAPDPALQGQLNEALRGLAGLSGHGSDLAGMAAQVAAVRSQVVALLTAAGATLPQTQPAVSAAPSAPPGASGGAAPSGSAVASPAGATPTPDTATTPGASEQPTPTPAGTTPPAASAPPTDAASPAPTSSPS